LRFGLGEEESFSDGAGEVALVHLALSPFSLSMWSLMALEILPRSVGF
jgi:hypothetical protein